MDIVEYTIRKGACTYRRDFHPSKWLEFVEPEALDVALEHMLDCTQCTFAEARAEICAILAEVLNEEKEG